MSDFSRYGSAQPFVGIHVVIFVVFIFCVCGFFFLHFVVTVFPGVGDQRALRTTVDLPRIESSVLRAPIGPHSRLP